MPLVLKEKLGLCQEHAEWPGVGGQGGGPKFSLEATPPEFPPSPLPGLLYAPIHPHTSTWD